MPSSIDIAHRMRLVMALDLEEFALAHKIEEENARLNEQSPELLQEAFAILSSTERRCWKAWIEYRGKYERQQ